MRARTMFEALRSNIAVLARRPPSEMARLFMAQR
jgi:hypothetical protein